MEQPENNTPKLTDMSADTWNEIIEYLDQAEVLATLADLNQHSRDMIAARPGVYLVDSTNSLIDALGEDDAQYIIVIKSGLEIAVRPTKSETRIVTRRADMVVSGNGELYLAGEGASATINGGLVHAYNGATITNVTGGEVNAYGTAKVAEVNGGEVYANGTTTITVVNNGQVSATDNARIIDVFGGEAYTSRSGSITYVNDGQVKAHGKGTITHVTGGEVIAYDNVTINSVAGGMATASQTAKIDNVIDGEAYAKNSATITNVTGGEAYLLGNATLTSITGGTAVATDNSVIEDASGTAAIRAKGNAHVTVGAGGTDVTVDAYEDATVYNNGGGNVIAHSHTVTVIT